MIRNKKNTSWIDQVCGHKVWVGGPGLVDVTLTSFPAAFPGSPVPFLIRARVSGMDQWIASLDVIHSVSLSLSYFNVSDPGCFSWEKEMGIRVTQ
jgi:hypothetical protein